MAEDLVIGRAQEAERIAGELIPQFHLHLLDARILYLTTTQKRKKCNRVRLASAQKFSALDRYLSSKHLDDGLEASIYTGADFLILFDRLEWEGLSRAQQVALVDHELSHCARYEKITDTGVEGRWGLKGHDIEEFLGVLQRHGAWRKEIEDTAQVIKQFVLPLDAAVMRMEGLKSLWR